MNTNMKRVISGLAALGIALSGMALGTSSAWADEGSGTTTGPIPAGSTTIKESDKGTITISGGAVDHKFNGYKLGYLTSIEYGAISDADNAAMSGYTLATNQTYKGAIETALENITDTNATGDDSGKTLKQRYLADRNYCGRECTPAATGEPNDPNPLGWFFENYGGGYEKGAPWGGGAKGDASDASVLRQFATKVSAAIAQMSSASTDVKELKSSKSGYENPVDQGYYLLRDTTDLKDTVTPSDNKKETQSAPILVSTTYKVTIGGKAVTFNKDAKSKDLGTVVLKNSTPTITKEVVTDKGGATAQAKPDYAVGDTVYYKLTATLPSYTGYAVGNRVYQITDTASAGLTVEQSTAVESVTVTLGDITQTLKNTTDYTVAVADNATDADDSYKGGKTTTIDFANYVNLKEGTQSRQNKILEGGTITVIFKATLNKDARISDASSIKGNPNKDSLTYSNQPEDVSKTHTTPGDKVNVYTYRFRLHKTNKGGEDLSGAKFKVKAPEGGATDWLQWDATASVWKHVSEESATEFVSNGEGEVVATVGDKTINLDRLDSGTYTVKEISAPDKYTQAFLPTFTFTITPTMGSEDAGHKTITDVAFSGLAGDGAITGDTGYVTKSAAIADGIDAGAWQYTIYNAKNLTELPMTGGAGLVAIIAVGVLLAGAGTAAAVRSRKSTSRAVRV